MLEINDYKIICGRKIKRISKIWITILIFIIIGIIFINNSFKYEEYYETRGEYRDGELVLYVAIDDVSKITKNSDIVIEKEKFAYKINSIEKENVYLNDDYYKIVKLSIADVELVNNSIVDMKIVLQRHSLLKYIFETVWRE